MPPGAARRSTRALRMIGALVVIVAMLFLAACGDDDASGGSESGSATNGGSGGGSSFVSASQQIADTASSGVVWGTATGYVEPTAITPDNADRVPPFELEDGSPPRTVYFVALGPTGTFNALDRIFSNIGAELGWTVTTLYSDFTPAGHQRQFAAAIRANPDAIIGGSTPAPLVGAQLADAEAQGIPVVNFGDAGKIGAGYTHAVPGGFNLQFELLGAKIVADSGGSADVIWVDGGEGYANVEMDVLPQYLEQCDDCTVTADKVAADVAVDPVKARQYISSLVRREPNVEYIVWPFAEPVYGAALEAVRASGSSAKLVTIQGTPLALEAVRSGQAPFVASYPLAPTALEVVDVLLRTFANAEVPNADAWTAGTSLWEQDGTLPQGSTIKDIEIATAESSSFDYLAEYGGAWGVNLDGIFEGVE